MAIIIDEQRRGFNWFALAVFLLIISISAIATYYLFFTSSPYVDKALPSQFKDLQALSPEAINPEAIISNPVYQSLKRYVGAINLPATPYRANPFLP
jgi:hypothetical protein